MLFESLSPEPCCGSKRHKVGIKSIVKIWLNFFDGSRPKDNPWLHRQEELLRVTAQGSAAKKPDRFPYSLVHAAFGFIHGQKGRKHNTTANSAEPLISPITSWHAHSESRADQSSQTHSRQRHNQLVPPPAVFGKSCNKNVSKLTLEYSWLNITGKHRQSAKDPTSPLTPKSTAGSCETCRDGQIQKRAGPFMRWRYHSPLAVDRRSRRATSQSWFWRRTEICLPPKS